MEMKFCLSRLMYQAAPLLVPKTKDVGKKMTGLVELSCAFGNTLTLPLLFILAVVPEAAADSAVAYVALFLAVSAAAS